MVRINGAESQTSQSKATSMGKASKTLDPRLHIRQLYGTEGPLWVVNAFQTPHPWFVTGAPFKILLCQLRGKVTPPPVDHQALPQKKKQKKTCMVVNGNRQIMC